jgi:hypothetical protein
LAKGGKGETEKVAKEVGEGRCQRHAMEEKEKKRKRERKARQRKSEKQELLHPPPLWVRARSAALGQCPLGGASVVVRDK